MRRIATIGLVLVLLMAGCSGVDPTPSSPTGTVSPASTDTPTPSAGGATATPTATAGESVTSTSTLTSTPTPSPIRTTTSTETPSPSTPTRTTTPTETAGSSESITVEVTDVVDGDTLHIRYDNGSEDTVRLLGVDTPEIHSEPTPDEWEGVPNNEAGKDCLRAAGHDASDYVTQRVEGETVRLTFDENEGRRGYYGRLLAYVYHGGNHLNYRLVEQGHARVYDSSFEKRERFYAAESDAQSREINAWDCRNVESSTATPTPTPWGGGSDGGSLSVAQVHADAEGNDHENENDEYVVFENTGESSLDLSGWTVSDEADHTYTVPQGFTLDPGARVTLYTGSGSNTDSKLYWGSDAAIWNNGGDTIYVRDDDGSTRVEYSYSG